MVLKELVELRVDSSEIFRVIRFFAFGLMARYDITEWEQVVEQAAPLRVLEARERTLESHCVPQTHPSGDRHSFTRLLLLRVSPGPCNVQPGR